jgi:hypothetical protein
MLAAIDAERDVGICSQLYEAEDIKPCQSHDFGNFSPVIPGCKLRVMSNNGRSVENGNPGAPEVREQGASPVTQETDSGEAAQKKTGRSRYPDMQSAVRFPIKLPVSVKSNAGESAAQTQNISANGVLFQMDSEMPVGSMVDFTISLPANVLGAEVDVQLDCRGRVVRSFEEDGRRGVGVVIDEYHFDRR